MSSFVTYWDSSDSSVNRIELFLNSGSYFRTIPNQPSAHDAVVRLSKTPAYQNMNPVQKFEFWFGVNIGISSENLDGRGLTALAGFYERLKLECKAQGDCRITNLRSRDLWDSSAGHELGLFYDYRNDQIAVDSNPMGGAPFLLYGAYLAAVAFVAYASVEAPRISRALSDIHIELNLDWMNYSTPVTPLATPSGASSSGGASGGKDPCKDPSAKGGVYELLNVLGDVVRTGRANDLARRRLEHLRNPLFKGFDFNVRYRTDDYATIRGLEERVYLENGPSGAANDKIRPISPKNPRASSYRAATSKCK